MKWKFKPIPTIKTLAATLSMWTMCIAPVAQGAEAASNKQLINQYLKESGLTTQKMTIGQFWGKVRHIYPTVLQKQLDPWIRLHKNEFMPSIEASSFKDADNHEQVRLLLTSGKDTGTLTFTGDDEKPLKINGVTLSRTDLDYNKFEQMMLKIGNKTPALNKSIKNESKKSSSNSKATVVEKRFLKGKDLAKLSLHKQMDYFLKMRTAVQAADRVLELNKGQKGASFDYSTSDSAVASLWQILLGANAVAKAADQQCIASGWVASYHNGSCARPEQGRATLLKQVEELPFSANVKTKVAGCAKSGGLPCNPLLFGFDDNSGSPICITSNLPSATKQCNEKVPLPRDKEKIIQSIVAARGGDGSLCKLKDDSTVSQACADKLEKYTDNLQSHYLTAAKFCTKGGVSDIGSRAEWEQKERKDLKKDQKEACDNLKDRFFDLQIEVTTTPLPLVAKCPQKIPGAHDGEGGVCLCDDGTSPHPVQTADGGGNGGKHGNKHGNTLPPPPSAPGDVSDGSSESDGQLTCEPVSSPVANTDLPGAKVAKTDSCQDSFLCKYKWPLILGSAAALVGLGLYWWLSKKSTPAATPAFVAPAPPPLADPTVAPAAPVIDPVPTNPCPAPNTVINGVCTAPIFTPPPPPPAPPTPAAAPSNEGGSGTGPTGGAIR